MRDFALETKQRVQFIKDLVASAGAAGIVYGNSGGKDSALVGILCKMACENTVGLIMPCGSRRNYAIDRADAEAVARQYNIEARVVDLSETKAALAGTLHTATELTPSALANIAPRLRMAALYAVAASENRLVAGTGNRSEIYLAISPSGVTEPVISTFADLTANGLGFPALFGHRTSTKPLLRLIRPNRRKELRTYAASFLLLRGKSGYT